MAPITNIDVFRTGVPLVGALTLSLAPPSARTLNARIPRRVVVVVVLDPRARTFPIGLGIAIAVVLTPVVVVVVANMSRSRARKGTRNDTAEVGVRARVTTARRAASRDIGSPMGDGDDVDDRRPTSSTVCIYLCIINPKPMRVGRMDTWRRRICVCARL